ncbi:MAG: hypothetical protein QOJ65_150 [Fimbriimonadaceae bacterium]|jgi:hypothetical protein|nr:hypothetical protein [Fimbriimonadaceae bacterium]
MPPVQSPYAGQQLEKAPVILSGVDLLAVIIGAHACTFTHDPLIDPEHLELLAGFLQDLEDWAEIGEDLRQGDRVRAAHSLQETLKELVAVGYVVIGKRSPTLYKMSGVEAMLDVAFVCVRRREWVELENEVGCLIINAKDAAKEMLAEDPNRDFFVWWDDIDGRVLNDFEELLGTAAKEEEMQVFLKQNSILLVQHLNGGHGRWVIPKQRLGCEHVTDFVIGSRDSIGYHWWAIELESPRAKPFTKSGDPSRHLTHAIRQISDWRSWLTTNQNYAARSRSEHGLGLTDIDNHAHAVIVIGREQDYDGQANTFRRQQLYAADIHIHSYDWLLSVARDRQIHLLQVAASRFSE